MAPIRSDILNSRFDQDELEREKHVILQELGAAIDTPDDCVFDRFTETAYRHQTLGRAILGTRETIQSFTPDMIRNYISREYSGERITGKLEPGKFERGRVHAAANDGATRAIIEGGSGVICRET